MSGAFTKRGNDSIREYSGLICIDIDDLKTEAKWVRDQLSKDSHALLTFLSPSGKGVKCVFKVNTPVERHKEAFAALAAYLKNLYEIEVDGSCSDVARACFLSYDPDASHNPNAKAFLVPPKRENVIQPPEPSSTNLDKYIQANFKVIKVEEDGYCVECPGKENHTGKNSDRDCKVFTEGSPKLYCFHQSCDMEVKKANVLLKSSFRTQSKPKTKDIYDRVRDHLQKLESFHTKDDETFVVLENGRSHRTSSRVVKDYINRKAWNLHKGQLNKNKLEDAVAFLGAMARFEGKSEDVYLRVAGNTNEVIIDKSQRDSGCIVCTKDGWGEYDQSPVKFITQKGTLPLFEPHRIPNASIELLHKFMNLDQDTFAMVYGYLINCFNPLGPYFVGVVTGQQGSAKTTHCKQIKRLIDPHSAPARQSNIKAHDIAIAARNNFMLLVDNMSGASAEVSDIICQISTGGSFGSRKLYQDDEEHFFSFKRPVLLNGIDEIATRGDLADRSVPIRLSGISDEKRKPDSEVEELFMLYGPQLMSALLDGVCSAIKNLPTANPPFKSRMSGPVQWVTAAEVGLGLKQGRFSETYERLRTVEARYRMDESPIGRAINKLVLQNNYCWFGSAVTLLQDLNELDLIGERHCSDWPKDARALGKLLKRIKPDLEKGGLEMDFDRTATKRTIVIRRIKRE